MSKHKQEGKNEKDVLISRLIRAAGEELESEFERPAEEAIVANLMGSATDEKEREDRAALLRTS
ncbi:MAG: hypothetical protein JSV33_00240, partial [bacterium]